MKMEDPDFKPSMASWKTNDVKVKHIVYAKYRTKQFSTD